MLRVFLRKDKMIPLLCRGIFSLLFVFLFLCGCSRGKKDTPDIKKTTEKKLRVSVSILPQKYFVQRIAGHRAEINVMIPPGHSPATYEPTPQQMKQLTRSHIYFRIGHIAFEKAWMKNLQAANQNMKIVDTSKGVQLIENPGRSATAADRARQTDYVDKKTSQKNKIFKHSSTGHQEEENHPEEHNHSQEAKNHHHTGIDPHTWLSPGAVKVQTQNIMTAFVESDPGNKTFYEENLENFTADINRLQEEIGTSLKDLRGKKFMVFHPAWGYLARDFGLVQVAIEIEGKEPNPADLKRVIDIARKENIRVIFVQQQFAVFSAESVAKEINGEVVLLDPLSADWLKNMKKIGKTFKELLK